MIWKLTPLGLIPLVAMAALLLAGIHMILQPGPYVGRGPIPARDARNVRIMGVLFVLLGGGVTAFFTVPIFLLS
jgi:hypothetical protein